MNNEREFLLDVWAFREGIKVHPYTGLRGPKKGKYSVNFESGDNTKFQAMDEEELVEAITSGAFCERGTIRMMAPMDSISQGPNAFAPVYFRGERIRDEYSS